MEITAQQAVDIAKNLCGGKLRGKLSAEKDAQQALLEEEMNDFTDMEVHAHHSIPTNEDGDSNQDEKEEEEPVYYFDLVQLMCERSNHANFS